MYVSWNAMFVSAYLEAARVLDGVVAESCRRFALKALERMLKEAWSASRGFAHRVGGPALEGSLDDQIFGVLALLEAYETTLESRYFEAAKKTMDLAIARYGDPDGGGFFDRASDAAPMGGLDVRRKPFQDSPTPGMNSMAAIALIRLHSFSGDEIYRVTAEKTLEAFAGIAPRYGLFAATYGLAATLFAHHPLQIVITGAADDWVPGTKLAALAGALKETLPHLPADQPVAIICAGQSCLPPATDAAQLTDLLQNVLHDGAAGAAAPA
jgi:uncharacterized protein YyaL (SSP411 family)